MRPRPWNDLDDRVAAAAGRDPASARDLVREIVQSGVRRALTVDAEHQVGEGIKLVGVAAVLADEDVGPELAQERRHDRVERPQPSSIVGAGRKCDVNRRPLGARATELGASPVPGNKVRGLSCRLMVRTRGSS